MATRPAQSQDLIGSRAQPEPVDLVMTANTWSYQVQFNRRGLADDESLVVAGELALSEPGYSANLPVPCIASIERRVATSRMELEIGSEMARLALPLEEFTWIRAQEKMREYAGQGGMVLRLKLVARDIAERQLLESVEFNFTDEGSLGKPA